MSRIISAVAGAMLVISLGSVDAKAAYNAAAGKTVYDASCVACHASGIMGAPKVGLKTAWTSRIPQGLETMVQKSIKGYQGTKGMMPAKGGNAKLTNAEVGNAVAYMVEQSK
ncbi:MAG: c-type cytochrome [Candidatus Chlorobium antarcticum]|jgi:cytochrome c5|nr:c-type cytochrome [Candidatus Chlorobium antarcticum]